MSNELFPTLRGLQYPIGKTPKWNTITQESISGVKKFLQCYTYPFYTFSLSFSYLGDENAQKDDIHTLMSFYNKVGGSAQSFLFADPLFEPNNVVKQVFGAGDGTRTKFRLYRTYGSFTEPVFGILNKPIVFVGNVKKTAGTDYTWDNNGLITFASPPANGSVLRWTGRWFYRCHFQDDEAEFKQIFYGGWELDEIILESIKLE